MDQAERVNIRSIVTEIVDSNVADKETHFGRKYSVFKDKYPNLFRVCCEGKIDKTNLDFMLSMLSKMENQNLTQYDASAEVGQMLFSKYVEPNIKR